MKRAAAIVMLLCLAGCGSSSPSDKIQSAVSHLQDVLATYNGTPQPNLAATRNACRQARNDLSGQDAFTAVQPIASRRAEVTALRDAYSLASTGFRDCAVAASTWNYPLMVTAVHELIAANQQLRRARGLEPR